MNIYTLKQKIRKSLNDLRIPEVVLGGFEPPLTEPKTVVLPLHHGTIFHFCVQR